MTTFVVDDENNITAYAEPPDHATLGNHFTSEKEFLAATGDWPTHRLVDVWNAFAGVVPFDDLKPVRKFTDRKTAVNRIWKAIQRLTPEATPAPKVAPRAAKKTGAAKESTAPAQTPQAREGSKKAIVLELLRRPTGATLAEIMAATDWQQHTVRGFISGTITKKMCLNVESTKAADGGRAYRITN